MTTTSLATVSAFSRVLLLVLLLLAGAGEVRAQYPAELAGRVVDAATSLPVEGAAIEIAGAVRALSDGRGAFLVRGLEPGRVELRVSRPGYASAATAVRATNGRRAHIVVALEAAPIELDPIVVMAPRAEVPGTHTIGRAAIETSGARTLGELVRDVPGVVVRAGTGGGGEHVSIRGGGPDAVLVLVDGVRANDPLTGVADVSTVALDDVESVRVMPGAHSARYGPRAEAGVILVTTRRADATRMAVSVAAGSLGAVALDADAALHLGSAVLSAGARRSERDESFTYVRPETLGGGTARRMNADARTLGGFAGVRLALPAGALRVRADVLDTERGLPGPVHALTPLAEQSLTRATITADWLGPLAAGRFGSASLRVDAHASAQRLRFEDPAPPIGPAYADSARMREAGLRAEVELDARAARGRRLALGIDLRGTELVSTTLTPREIDRGDLGVFARGVIELPTAHATELALAARVDRWDDGWIASHDVTLRGVAGPLAAHVSHRSGFSPPSPSDQFFRAGFAIAPNPALRPERVPSEIELGLSATLDAAGVPLEVGASAFRGDIEGMIVWAPDFRFVWSPRNHDVKRSGGEAWLRATPARSLELSAWASVARVTYDWPGDADTVQVVYRPRYSGGGALDWNPGAWRMGVAARHTGVRYASPGHANPLPAYWDVDVALSREWRIAPVLLVTSVAIDRVLNNHDAFVHGHPEPGRTVRLELGIVPATSPGG